MENLNIPQLQQLIDEDKLSSVELTEYYIERIKKYNKEVNAVLELFHYLGHRILQDQLQEML